MIEYFQSLAYMAFGLSLNSLFSSSPGKSVSKTGVLGVDIGSSSLKVVQLKLVKNVPTLETYGELQLGPYDDAEIGRGTRLPLQKSVEALVDIVREAGVTAKETSSALSYASSFTSVISIPTLNPEEITTMLPIEARKYVPISLTKVTLDWKLIDVIEAQKQSRVLLSAIYTEAKVRYESIIKGAGLAPAFDEIELFSSVRSVVSPQDERVAVIDFGASSTRLYIVERGVVKKTHSTILSGTALTQALEKGSEKKFAVAEELKRSVGLHGSSQDPRVQKILVDELQRGLREIHTVLARYAEEEKAQIQKVYVSGGGASLPGLKEFTSDLFSLPIEIANPFMKVAYPAFLEDTLKEAGPSFVVAVGAALRAFETK